MESRIGSSAEGSRSILTAGAAPRLFLPPEEKGGRAVRAHRLAGGAPVSRLVLCALAAAVAGCDWVQSSFVNSIPLQGTRTDEMFVYLAYDGLAPATVQDAMARGAFAGEQWRSAHFVTDFPGSSDASWTRILRTGRLHGYEYE